MSTCNAIATPAVPLEKFHHNTGKPFVDPTLYRTLRTVARSSTKVEYRAIGATATEVTWLMSLLCEISMAPNQAPILWYDNVGATYLTVNPIFHSRMKHIEVEYHFVCDMVDKGSLQVRYISSKDQIANVFTKGLSKGRHQ
ncbi:hypothetical protein GH714_017723 [Hevea brasiliensis]|uniref:Reverse transcriptase Ty1/copia-type domain-containing protein n=1 Tax=Hevea brasiliensis TaxID=3981 RepID=A0A6A6L3D6_HEVBR|nr:hypothetical protein GH714_017580 [Hevea brasiliensis]KAF2294780.1 hypothetical protein GH714_017723 [Hevea brasiliensis]